MKIQYVLMAILVIGLFGASFAFAESESGSSQSSVDVVMPNIASQEIDTSIDEAVTITQCKRSGASNFLGLTGGLTGNNQGYMTNLAIVTSKVVCSSGDMSVAVASMKLGEEKYRLFQRRVDGNNFVLYVLPKDAKLSSVDDAATKSVGTLTLTLKDSYPQLKSYVASLELKSGSQIGTWTGLFYARPGVPVHKEVMNGEQNTETKTRPVPSEKVRAAGETSVEAKAVNVKTVNKVSLWRRLFPKRVEATAQVDATAEAQ